MASTILISIISSIGLGISLFFGIYLLKSKKIQNIVLGILLITLSLRISKSVFYNFIDLPVYIKNLGLAANLAIGPLLYFYGRSLFNISKTFKKSDLLHFIPTVSYIILCNHIVNDYQSNLWRFSYSFVLLQSFCYVFLSIRLYVKKSDNSTKEVREWFIMLVTALSVIWLIYTLIFIKILPVYSAGSIAFTVLIFLLSFLAFNRRKIFEENPPKKYANSKITLEQGTYYLKKIENILQEERLYLDAKLTLESLSSKLDLSTRDISLIINRHTNQNFSSFINTYRIEEAKRLLLSTDENIKIVSIALDSGFYSLSSFNVAFKATTKLTPSEYRSKYTSHTF